MENIEFSFSDAWVLTALYSSHRDLDNLDFSGIIAAGDGLNNAILSAEEIRNAFIKFQSTGLIEKLSTKIEYSEKGKELIQQCLETKGGQFSRIETFPGLFVKRFETVNMVT